MCCSIDATGETGEWIRTGLDWTIWLDNFKQGMFLNSLYGMDAMVLDITLTLPGMLDMKSIIDLAVELGVKSYVKITFDFDSSAVMSPMCLPRDILNAVCDNLIAYEQANGNELTRVYSQTFADMKTRPTFQDKYPDWKNGLKRGKERYQCIAAFRKDGTVATTIEKIFQANPAILAWWQNI